MRLEPGGRIAVTDAAVVGRLLDEYHDRSIPPADIRLVAGSVHETQVTYRLSLPDGSAQLIRAFRAEELVPVHGRGPTPTTMADWLLGRARTLEYLAEVGYPAPRPVRSRTGELIGVAGPWLCWATTRVPGAVLKPSLEQLRLLGAALGRLHSVPTRPGDLAPGSRHPAVAVPVTLARLESVAALVPPGLRSLYEAFLRCVERVRAQAGFVPEVVAHGDVWAGNAVQDALGAVTLIDWETGGLGLAVLDLGNFLMECQLDTDLPGAQPIAGSITLDEARIEAAAAGYVSRMALPAAELELLPCAVLFSTAVVGAIHLEAALVAGVSGPSMDARLARLRSRVEVADTVATVARPYLAGL